MVSRFDRFTEGVRRALDLAQQESGRLGQRHIGTEHILLGLIAQGDGIAARVLANLGVRQPAVRSALEARAGNAPEAASREVGLTPRAKKVIERAVDEARRLNHRYIGTEHLLLGLLRVADSTGATVLRDLGVGHDQARQQVMAVLTSGGGFPPPPAPNPPGPIDFERFNEGARRVLVLAQEEAQRFRHNYIGTEHLLLGLTRASDGGAARVLSDLGVQPPQVRSAIEFIIGRGEAAITGEIGLTPRAQTVLTLAVDEARRMNHDHVGDEHLLLGLVREGEGIAAGVLASLGVRLHEVRARTALELWKGETQQGTVTAPEHRADQQEPPQGPLASAQTPPGELRQVIPIVQHQAIGDCTIVGIAIERYDNLFIATWQITIAGEAGYPFPLLQISAEDDRGNHYRGAASGGSGGRIIGQPYQARHAHSCSPALDPHARSLTLTVTLEPVQGPSGTVGGSWRFSVAIPSLPER